MGFNLSKVWVTNISNFNWQQNTHTIDLKYPNHVKILLIASCQNYIQFKISMFSCFYPPSLELFKC